MSEQQEKDLTTPAQRTFVHGRELEFGNAAVDYELTMAVRKMEPNAHNWIAVISMLPGTRVMEWIVDAGGAVVMEGGLGGGQG